MTSRVAPFMLASASIVTRLAGDQGPADILAVAYLAILTLHLYRASELRAAVRVAVRS